jgi:hypothetical protein
MHLLGVRQICPFGAHVIDLAAPPLRPRGGRRWRCLSREKVALGSIHG